MTVRASKPSILVLCLALLCATVAVVPQMQRTAAPQVELGRGPEALACVGCLSLAVYIAMGGWAAVLVAAAKPGSAVAAAGCVAACAEAVIDG